MGHRDLWLRAEAALQVVGPTEEQRQCLAEVLADYAVVVSELELRQAELAAIYAAQPQLKPVVRRGG